MKPASNKRFSLDLPTVVLPKSAVQVMSVCVMTTALAACGGSGGTSGGEIEGGSTDIDIDGDGTFEPIQGGLTTDSDNDGLFDNEEIDLLFTDPNNPDTDGDGITDDLEDFDGDGIANLDELNNGTDPTVNQNPTTPEEIAEIPDPDLCLDPNSSNASWSDNCQLRRFGTFATSLYTQGVQRILFCEGFGGTSPTISSFADGIFGPITDLSVRDFQVANNLLDDGIVGPATWDALFETLTLLAPDVQIGGILYAQNSINNSPFLDCDPGTVQFYQEIDQNGFDLLGWQMASNPGSTILVDFSDGDPVPQ